MPIEIDCPECDNGKIYEETGVCHPVTGFAEVLTHQCPNCKDGKIKVYTQEELDKAVEAETDDIIDTIIDLDIETIGDKISYKAGLFIHGIRARGK